MTVLTVSQINTYIKSLIESAEPLRRVYITGEISNFKRHYPSGHLYFTLKDDKSQIRGVMYKTAADKLKFEPSHGLKVIIHGDISVFERNGEYQIKAYDMQPDGLGALNLAYEQLKEKLFDEGLFDESYKKPLPKYPAKIGVATSSTGSVIQDIKNVCKRRYPMCEIVLVQTLVQGESAAGDIVKSLKMLDSMDDIDLIIVGRGGGSLEDLWAFNTEEVARAVFACRKPVISAVGHETDKTICDWVADVSAPTPSAAAEIAVPSTEEIFRFLRNADYTLKVSLQRRLDDEKQRLDSISSGNILMNPAEYIESYRDALNTKLSDMVSIFDKTLTEKRYALSSRASKLDALSPLGVLCRGYSVTFKNNSVLKSVGDVDRNDDIKVMLSDGYLDCTVNEVNYE